MFCSAVEVRLLLLRKWEPPSSSADTLPSIKPLKAKFYKKSWEKWTLCSPKALIHQETMISKIWFVYCICFSDFWVLFGNYVRRVCPRKINFLESILKCFTESHLWFEPKLLLEALYGNVIYNLPHWTLLCLLWINQALKQRIWFCMKYPYPLKISGRIQEML